MNWQIISKFYNKDKKDGLIKFQLFSTKTYVTIVNKTFKVYY